MLKANILAHSARDYAFSAGVVITNEGIIKNTLAIGNVSASAGQALTTNGATAGRVYCSNSGNIANTYFIESQEISSKRYNENHQMEDANLVNGVNSLSKENLLNLNYGYFNNANNMILYPNNVWVEVDGDYPKLYWEI